MSLSVGCEAPLHKIVNESPIGLTVTFAMEADVGVVVGIVGRAVGTGVGAEGDPTTKDDLPSSLKRSSASKRTS